MKYLPLPRAPYPSCVACRNSLVQEHEVELRLCESCVRFGARIVKERCSCGSDDMEVIYEKSDRLMRGGKKWDCKACGTFGFQMGMLTEDGIEFERAMADAEERPLPIVVQLHDIEKARAAMNETKKNYWIWSAEISLNVEGLHRFSYTPGPDFPKPLAITRTGEIDYRIDFNGDGDGEAAEEAFAELLTLAQFAGVPPDEFSVDPVWLANCLGIEIKDEWRPNEHGVDIVN